MNNSDSSNPGLLNPNPSIKSGISVENCQLEDGRETLKGKRIPWKAFPSIFPTGRDKSTLTSSLTGMPAHPATNKKMNKRRTCFLIKFSPSSSSASRKGVLLKQETIWLLEA